MKDFKKILLFLFILTVIFGAWEYYLPYYTASEMRAAASDGDIEVLNEIIDFPVLRENLKGQLTEIDRKTSTDKRVSSTLESILGLSIGHAVINRMVDTITTPSSIAALSGGSVPGDRETKFEILYRYDSFSRFLITLRDPRDKKDSVVLVLRRRGLDWKLINIQLLFLEDDNAGEANTPLQKVTTYPFPEKYLSLKVLPWEALKDNTFKKSFAAITNSLETPEWIKQLELVGQVNKFTVIEGKSVVVLSGCKPHSCDSDNLVVLYFPESSHATAGWKHGNRVFVFGSPNQKEKNAIEQLLEDR